MKRLQETGFYTVESVVYAPKNKLTDIKRAEGGQDTAGGDRIGGAYMAELVRGGEAGADWLHHGHRDAPQAVRDNPGTTKALQV